MAEKTKNYINNGKNPLIVKNADGKDQKVAVGEIVEITAELAAKLKIEGFIDVSKMVKPTGEDIVALKKENAELRAKVKTLEESLAQAQKETEALLEK